MTHQPAMRIAVALALALAAGRAQEDAARVEAQVEAALASLSSVDAKARQLDIFNVADMLTNGRVDPAKAARSWGDLALGVGTLHDVYASPGLSNEIVAFLVNASASKVCPPAAEHDAFDE